MAATLPETTAGASDRAGFMLAPDTGPAKSASSPMTAPPASSPRRQLPAGLRHAHGQLTSFGGAIAN